METKLLLPGLDENIQKLKLQIYSFDKVNSCFLVCMRIIIRVNLTQSMTLSCILYDMWAWVWRDLNQRERGVLCCWKHSPI